MIRVDLMFETEDVLRGKPFLIDTIQPIHGWCRKAFNYHPECVGPWDDEGINKQGLTAFTFTFKTSEDAGEFEAFFGGQI